MIKLVAFKRIVQKDVTQPLETRPYPDMEISLPAVGRLVERWQTS